MVQIRLYPGEVPLFLTAAGAAEYQKHSFVDCRYRRGSLGAGLGDDPASWDNGLVMRKGLCPPPCVVCLLLLLQLVFVQ